MPPRRSARVVAANERAEGPLCRLPPGVLQQILLLLPPDARARCACLCRRMRAIVAERSLWTRLDLTERCFFSETLLRGAAARAGGQLEALALTAPHPGQRVDLGPALQEVVAANAGTLRELRTLHLQTLLLPSAACEALCRAAPRLELFEAGVNAADPATARSMLRNEPPFGPLRLRQLKVVGRVSADLQALAADIAAHATLTSLAFYRARLDAPDALNAVVEAALTRRLADVEFLGCGLSAASVPALALLLNGGAVRRLSVVGLFDDAEVLLNELSAGVLAAALRGHRALSSFVLVNAELWHNVAACSAVLGALTAHPSLHTLVLSCNQLPDGHDDAHRTAVGAALGALVAANSPALHELEMDNGNLGDAGMAPLIAALPHNTHLRRLICWNNSMMPRFIWHQLLPAVRANTSLRELFSETDEADEFVRNREAARLRAEAAR